VGAVFEDVSITTRSFVRDKFCINKYFLADPPAKAGVVPTLSWVADVFPVVDVMAVDVGVELTGIDVPVELPCTVTA
jgi:hypothetical protein